MHAFDISIYVLLNVSMKQLTFIAQGVWSSCMIQHEAKPSAESYQAMRTQPECNKSRKAFRVNIKQYVVVAWVRRRHPSKSKC